MYGCVSSPPSSPPPRRHSVGIFYAKECDSKKEDTYDFIR